MLGCYFGELVEQWEYRAGTFRGEVEDHPVDARVGGTGDLIGVGLQTKGGNWNIIWFSSRLGRHLPKSR